MSFGKISFIKLGGDYLLAMCYDGSGSRTVEAFLDDSCPAIHQHKTKVIKNFVGHFPKVSPSSLSIISIFIDWLALIYTDGSKHICQPHSREML